MKIEANDMQILREWIKPILEANNNEATVHGYIAAGLTAKRFRWDALYASRMKIGDGRGTHGHVNLYAYCNDDHIDTALRTLCKEIDGPVSRAAGAEWLNP